MHRRNPRARVTICIACALALAGCAVGPDYVRPVDPAASAFTRDPVVLVQGTALVPAAAMERAWWRAYKSPSIDALVEAARANNPNIEAALANLKAAQENVRAQRGFFYPTVQVGYTPSRQSTASAISPALASGESVYTLHTAQLTVGYVPDVFGGNRRQVESLQSQAESQRFQLAALRVTVTTNVVAAALQEASLLEQIRVVEETIGVNRQQLERARLLQRSGYSAGLDVATQETSYAQALALLPPLNKQLEQTRNLLAILCGKLPSERVPVTSVDAVVFPPQLPLTLPSQLLAQRPDVQAAEEQVRAANAQVGVATANLLPQFSITASLGYVAPVLGGLFAAQNQSWGLVGGVTAPLFAGGTLRARKRAAEAAFIASLAQYRGTVLTAFQNVADTLHALEFDGRSLAAAKDVEAATQRVVNLTQRQFELGYVSGLLLLSAKQAYLQARVNRVQAYGAYLGDTAALYQALGGGWTAPGGDDPG